MYRHDRHTAYPRCEINHVDRLVFVGYLNHTVSKCPSILTRLSRKSLIITRHIMSNDEVQRDASSPHDRRIKRVMAGSPDPHINKNMLLFALATGIIGLSFAALDVWEIRSSTPEQITYHWERHCVSIASSVLMIVGSILMFAGTMMQ
jgi:hypothetical protein